MWYFFYVFTFFRVGRRWGCLLQFFLIVEFYTLEERKSVYVAVPLLTALSQTYSRCLTMCCCFTDLLQVKTSSEELASTNDCKEVTTFLCYFQSHLSIKYNLCCFLHQKSKLLRAGTNSYSFHSIGQHKTRVTWDSCLQRSKNNGGFTTRAAGQSFPLSIQDLWSGVPAPSKQLKAVDNVTNLIPSEDKTAAMDDDGSRRLNLLSSGDSLPFLGLCLGGSSKFLWIGKVPGQLSFQLLLSLRFRVWRREGRGHRGEGAVGCWHTKHCRFPPAQGSPKGTAWIGKLGNAWKHTSPHSTLLNRVVTTLYF